MEIYLTSAIEDASRIREQRYPDAEVVLLAGSVVRGEATATSDLDLVVVFPKVEQAYRESFFYGGWPIEAFVHDRQTLEYFFLEIDRPSGVPALPAMVAEGIEVPGPSAPGGEIKNLAQRILSEGPPAWSDEDRANSRYAITDMIEDIRAPRSEHELRSTLANLYQALTDHFCRSRGVWSAKGKAAIRRLSSIDPEFSNHFRDAFDAGFVAEETEKIIHLAQEVLEPDGGFLFDGYRRLAPKEWRVKHEK